MSYCRFSLKSDVYMFHHCDGYIECCACHLHQQQQLTYPIIFYKRSEALAHLQEHIDNGYTVPDYAIKRLETEIEKIGDNVVSNDMFFEVDINE